MNLKQKTIPLHHSGENVMTNIGEELEDSKNDVHLEEYLACQPSYAVKSPNKEVEQPEIGEEGGGGGTFAKLPVEVKPGTQPIIVQRYDSFVPRRKQHRKSEPMPLRFISNTIGEIFQDKQDQAFQCR